MTLPLTSTDGQIIRLTEGLFNLQPGFIYLTDFRTYVEDNNINDFADALINYLGNPDNQTLAELIVANLGLSGSAATSGIEYLIGQYESNPHARGMVTSQTLDIFSTLVNDDTYGAAASQFNADVSASLAYSSNPNNTQVIGSENVSNTTFDLSVLNDNLIGTSKDNLFNADVVQNSLGEQTNELASGDYINGGAGNDVLMAEVQPASALNNGPQSAIKPQTVDVEEAWFTALTTATAQTGNAQTVYINAKDMLGLDSVASYQSDASLVIENLTTLMDDGVYANRRDTETVTIRFDHSGNDVAVDQESDLTVLFDNDYLVSGQTSLAQAFYWLLDEKAELAGNENRLAEIDTNGLIFDIDGQTYTVASEAARLAGTHEGFVAELQAELAKAQEAGEIPASVAISLNYDITDITGLDDGSLSAEIPAIVVSTTDGILTPLGFSKPQGLTGDYDVYGTFDNEFQQADLPVVSTIELEKIGRGAEGGDLTVGGMATDLNNVWDYSDSAIKEGVEVFNITVSGDDTQDSNLASLQSTNNTLEEVNVRFAAGSEADLYIGNHNTNMISINGANNTDDDMTNEMNSALKDVRDFNASSAGSGNDVSVYAYLSDESVAKYMDLTDTDADPKADNDLNYDANAEFNYSFGAGDDMLNINISKNPLAQSGTTNREDFSLDIDGGAGDDTIETQIGDGTGTDASHWYRNSEVENNLAINAGSGNDTVRTWGAGSWNVDLGTGNDVIYSDNSGNQNNVANDVTVEVEDLNDINYNSGRAVWVFNTFDQITAGAPERDIDNLRTDSFNDPNIDGANPSYDADDSHAFYNATVTVNLRGISATSDAIGEFNTTDLELNNIIKKVIQEDEFLSDLIVAEDGPGNTLVIRSLTDDVFNANDLGINIVSDNDFTLSSSQISSFARENGLVDADGQVTIDAIADVYAEINADIAAWTNGNDYTTAMANKDGVNLTGAKSTAVTASDIIDGDGNDTIVLSTSNLDVEHVHLVVDNDVDVIYNATNAVIYFPDVVDADDNTLVSVNQNNDGVIHIDVDRGGDNPVNEAQIVLSSGSTFNLPFRNEAENRWELYVGNDGNGQGPVDPPPAGLTRVDLTVGSTDAVIGDAAVNEQFFLDVPAAQAETDNTQIPLNGFDTENDALLFDITTAIAATTLDQLNGVDGIAVQSNPITQQTLVNFGPDANGDVITLTLAGILDPSLVDVTTI